MDQPSDIDEKFLCQLERLDRDYLTEAFGCDDHGYIGFFHVDR